jgi:hypothetical protein
MTSSWMPSTRIGSGTSHTVGDEVEAHIVGNRITGLVNGREVISATDDVFATGSPGIGFNFFVGHTNVDHGLTAFEVETDDD